MSLSYLGCPLAHSSGSDFIFRICQIWSSDHSHRLCFPLCPVKDEHSVILFVPDSYILTRFLNSVSSTIPVFSPEFLILFDPHSLYSRWIFFFWSCSRFSVFSMDVLILSDPHPPYSPLICNSGCPDFAISVDFLILFEPRSLHLF